MGYREGELEPEATIREFRIVRREGAHRLRSVGGYFAEILCRHPEQDALPPPTGAVMSPRSGLAGLLIQERFGLSFQEELYIRLFGILGQELVGLGEIHLGRPCSS